MIYDVVISLHNMRNVWSRDSCHVQQISAEILEIC